MGQMKVTLTKIPLRDLAELLQHLYQKGADYVDIVAVPKEAGIQDEIIVAVPNEYMNKDREEIDEYDDYGEAEEQDPDGVANIIEETPERKSNIDDFLQWS